MNKRKLVAEEWVKGTVRSPKTRIFICTLCGQNIECHHSYWDKGHGRRAHTLCVAYMRDNEEGTGQETAETFTSLAGGAI